MTCVCRYRKQLHRRAATPAPGRVRVATSPGTSAPPRGPRANPPRGSHALGPPPPAPSPHTDLCHGGGRAAAGDPPRFPAAAGAAPAGRAARRERPGFRSGAHPPGGGGEGARGLPAPGHGGDGDRRRRGRRGRSEATRQAEGSGAGASGRCGRGGAGPGRAGGRVGREAPRLPLLPPASSAPCAPGPVTGREREASPRGRVTATGRRAPGGRGGACALDPRPRFESRPGPSAAPLGRGHRGREAPAAAAAPSGAAAGPGQASALKKTVFKTNR
ncbi:collagen alpha-1(I) chain-like [Prinia subflava]|uniref:collagen alpha-1(I) chain-like n=1 Tax=Prinia subflava TaxID=208062 RepID=UPI002FE2C49F